MKRLFQSLVDKNEDRIKAFLTRVGYDYRHWTRPVMYQRCGELISELNPSTLDALEISPGQFFKTIGFQSYTEANFPDFDICESVLEKELEFDIIIADQVWEHLLWPYRATQNVLKMLRPGGFFLVTTPFLIRVHPVPHDCTRWTETGIRHFLIECGFDPEEIITGSWGNRACVKANFSRWARRGWFGSLRNEPSFPVAVWALARKKQEVDSEGATI
jgi:SAM-dependent methyltransferase